MKKKVIINFLISLLSQLIILFLGFIVPKIVLDNYGSDTNGLTSTITQIFQYLALLEAGISIAARNMLYKPILEDDKEQISIWLTIARKYYRTISFVYLAIVLGLSSILPVVFVTNVDYWTIFLYILFEGLASVVTFYFVNTWTCFLMAKGEIYIINIFSLITKIACYGVKIFLALYGINILFIQLGYFGVSLIQLLIYYFYMRRKYSWIDYHSPTNNLKLPNRKSFVITEIAGTIFSSTDMIVLSIFVSTSMSSVYSVYNLVFISLNALLTSVYNGISYVLSQTYVQDIEKYKKVHDLFMSLFVTMVTVFMCVSYMLILPFVQVYTKGVTDVNYIYYELPILFCSVQILSWSRHVGTNLCGIAGYAKTLSIVSLIEAIMNVVLSIVFVQFFGIIGVLLATVIALPLKVIVVNWISDVKIMHRNHFWTLRIIITNYALFGITILLNHFFPIAATNYFELIYKGAVLFVICLIIVSGLNVLCNKDLLHVFNLFKKKKMGN